MRKPTLSILPILLGVMLLGAFISTQPAQAQSALKKDQQAKDQKDKEVTELKNEIRLLENRVETLEGLDQKVRVIDRKLEVQAETEQVKAREAPIIKADAQGFSISSANPDDWQLKFGGIIQGDGRFFTSGDDKSPSTFCLNRVRPILSGTLWKYYDFNITPDFGQGKVVLQDAYINDKYFQQAQLQVGKYKTPFGLERLQSDRDLLFSERALTNNLVPNRDTGAELHSDLFGGRLTYQLAAMNGVPNNTASVDVDNNDGKDFIGRVFAQPFKLSENQWAKGLGVGFAATYGDESNSTTSVYKTYGQSTWFSYNKGVTAAGARFRFTPQAYYHVGGFGLLAEYVSDRHKLNRNIQLKKGASFKYVNDYETFADSGYSVQGSYLLTGEEASYYGIKPYHPFDPRLGTWGAWEIAARISNLATDSGQFKLRFVDPSVSAKTATEYTVGINWYLSQNIKWQFDYARTFFNGGAGVTGAITDRRDESVFETQFQLAF